MGSGEENYRVYMIYIKIRPPHTLSQKYIFSTTKCMSIKIWNLWFYHLLLLQVFWWDIAVKDKMPKAVKRKKTKPRPCAVKDCKNNDPYRTFHRIPANPVMRQLWEAADVGLTNLASADPEQVKTWDRICSGHFTSWDFTLEQGEPLSSSCSPWTYN